MGHMYVAITSKVSAMAPELISRAHLTPGKFFYVPHPLLGDKNN